MPKSDSKTVNEDHKIAAFVICFECKQRVDRGGTVLCSLCNNNFEFDCVGYSESRHRLKNANARKNWKCKKCTNKQNRDLTTVSSVTNITLRKKRIPPKSLNKTPKVSLKPPQEMALCQTPPTKDSLEENVRDLQENDSQLSQFDGTHTQTASHDLDLSPNNTLSPAALSTPIEIAPNQTPPPSGSRGDNMQDCQISQIDDSHVLTLTQDVFDELLDTEDDFLSKSVDCGVADLTSMQEMKDTIVLLRSEYAILQNELDNTILEKNDLQRQVKKLNKENDILKCLCQSPLNESNINKKGMKRPGHQSVTQSPARQQRSSPSRNAIAKVNKPLITLHRTIYDLEQQLKQNEVEIAKLEKYIRELECKLSITDSSLSVKNSTSANTLTDAEPINNDVPKFSSLIQNTDEMNSNQILILGTQQCVGISSALKSSRENSPYGKYKVTAETKPFAKGAEVLKSCNNTDLKSGDILIIGVGENDTDLKKLTSLLRNIFNKFYFCDILLLNIFKNVSINKNYMNNVLSNLCNQFNNCQFVHCNNYNLIDICRSINYVIDCTNYHNKYLDVTALKNIILKKNSRPIQINHRQGTILNYSAQKQSIKNSSCVTMPPNTKPSGKNTIIDYSPKVNDKSFFRA